MVSKQEGDEKMSCDKINIGSFSSSIIVYNLFFFLVCLPNNCLMFHDTKKNLQHKDTMLRARTLNKTRLKLQINNKRL